MTRVNTTVLIDEDVKKMALSKGIKLSRTLEDSLKAELDIADIPEDEKDKIIAKLKLKVRKYREICSENCKKLAENHRKIVALEAKKDPKYSQSDNDKVRNHPNRARYAPKAELEGRI